MKLDRLLAGLCLSLALSLPAHAAPGHFTPVGPFGAMDDGVEQLIYPGADPQRMLILNAGDLFESRDGGHSWRSALANWPQIEAYRLRTDPGDPDHWYLTEPFAADSQIWHTTDAGKSWSILPIPSQAGGGRWNYLFVDRFQPENLALETEVHQPATGNQVRRFFSRDRGQSWTELELAGLADNFTQMRGINDGSLYIGRQRYELATGAVAETAGGGLIFDITRPDTLYMIDDGFPSADLYSSTDRGATRTFLRRVHHDFLFLAQSPKNPSHLALGASDGVEVSLDRGNTWNAIQPTPLPGDAEQHGAFDPATGELLLAKSGLVRRHLDGTFAAPLAIHGLLASTPIGLATGAENAFTLDRAGRVYIRDARGVFVPRGSVPFLSQCRDDLRFAILPDDPDSALVACGASAIFATRDGGATWTRALAPPPIPGSANRLVARGSEYFLLSGGQIYHSGDFGLSWDWLTLSPEGSRSFAVHPDPARGLVAVDAGGRINSRVPGEALLFGIGQLPGNGSAASYPAFAHDRAHPDLLYAIYGHALSRSFDFGRHWQQVANLETALPQWNPESPFAELSIDPFDSDHLLLLHYGVESRDGGQSWVSLGNPFDLAAFDRQVPGRLLAASVVRGHGVLQRDDVLPSCPDGEEAWCAGSGRYLLTVDWKDPLGQVGHGSRVATGNENSGLFHFFDANNWELLVKVLDGCALNQRQWVFAGGTTDVEYVLKVEDRWTGQIRHYANVAGQAAPAITDTDAFAGCGVEPPAGARVEEPAAAGGAGELALELVGGRFEARTRWTDFAGHQGDGLAVTLRTDNSGLFYFFDPANWEMLVKVLDGCALNGHYWVLAAATTDVGFELEVGDRLGNTSRTYRNPAGRAAPATIDLEAFACASP